MAAAKRVVIWSNTPCLRAENTSEQFNIHVDMPPASSAQPPPPPQNTFPVPTLVQSQHKQMTLMPSAHTNLTEAPGAQATGNAHNRNSTWTQIWR
eukprot:1920636-Ditylum_brightwellii.AAC.1